MATTGSIRIPHLHSARNARLCDERSTPPSDWRTDAALRAQLDAEAACNLGDLSGVWGGVPAVDRMLCADAAEELAREDAEPRDVDAEAEETWAQWRAESGIAGRC